MEPAKPRISEAAAQWAVRIHAGTLTPEEQAELDAWVAADVRHEGALARARAAWLNLDRLAALAAGRTPATTASKVQRSYFERRWLWLTLAASCAAVSLVAGGWFYTSTAANTYISGVGELRKVPLADGSTMLLNTATEVRVDFDKHRRSVLLTAGEALFEVAKDRTRPFVVDTGNLTVTAVGTTFAVRRQSDEHTDVTVTQGVVEIRYADATQPVQRVTANQRVAFDDSEPAEVEDSPPTDAERRLAWRSGMIAFDNEPLGAAIADFNRYSRRRIVVDAALAVRPITGIFRTTDIEEFAQTTAAALDAEAVDEAGTIYIRPRR